MNSQFDVAIVGAGLVGASMALALEPLGLSVALLEAQALKTSAPPGFDDRSLVLNLASLRILNALGVMSALAAQSCPVSRIVVTRQGEFGSLELNASEVAELAFGAVVPARVLGAQLHSVVASRAGICVLDGATVSSLELKGEQAQLGFERADGAHTLTARLVIGADGSFSNLRELALINFSEIDYPQTAIVAAVGTERAHENAAFERFTDHGPLALLPRPGKRMGVVWCQPADQIDAALGLSERDFLHALGQAAGWPLGRFSKPSPRVSYPIRLIRADSVIAERLVLIGNAANTLHPIGGQGLNLGLRDVAVLRDLLAQNPQAAGSAGQLDEYAQRRKPDQDATVQFTDTLARASASVGPLARAARAGALAALSAPGALRQTLMRHAMGFRGAAPTLMRGAA